MATATPPPISDYEKAQIADAQARLDEQRAEFAAKQAQDLAMFQAQQAQTGATDQQKLAFERYQFDQKQAFDQSQFDWAKQKFQVEFGWDQQKFNQTLGVQLMQAGLDVAKLQEQSQVDADKTIQAYRDELAKQTGPQDLFRYLYNVRGQTAPRGYQSQALPIPQAVMDWYSRNGIALPNQNPGDNPNVALYGGNNLQQQVAGQGQPATQYNQGYISPDQHAQDYMNWMQNFVQHAPAVNSLYTGGVLTNPGQGGQGGTGTPGTPGNGQNVSQVMYHAPGSYTPHRAWVDEQGNLINSWWDAPSGTWAQNTVASGLTPNEPITASDYLNYTGQDQYNIYLPTSGGQIEQYWWEPSMGGGQWGHEVLPGQSGYSGNAWNPGTFTEYGNQEHNAFIDNKGQLIHQYYDPSLGWQVQNLGGGYQPGGQTQIDTANGNFRITAPGASGGMLSNTWNPNTNKWTPGLADNSGGVAPVYTGTPQGSINTGYQSPQSYQAPQGMTPLNTTPTQATPLGSGASGALGSTSPSTSDNFSFNFPDFSTYQSQINPPSPASTIGGDLSGLTGSTGTPQATPASSAWSSGLPDMTNPANLPPSFQGLVGQGGSVTTPSAQQWQNMLPTEQQAFQSYVGNVAGGVPTDVQDQMKKLAPIQAEGSGVPTQFK